jgi:hypothetical protein
MLLSNRRFCVIFAPGKEKNYSSGVVVVEVVVEVVPDVVVADDACAWAGTTIDSTIGRVHFAGNITVTAAAPPIPAIVKTRRRVGFLSWSI